MKHLKDLGKLWRYRELLSELVKREIKARYKQSVLGYAWVILVPLINLIVLTVVFSFLVRVPTGGIPYPVFLFVALIPWTFTANAISFATSSLLANSSLVTKIKLPREIFPISAIIARIVDLVLSTLILLLLLFFYSVPLSWMLLWVPLVFIVHLILVIGVSFILSAINVYFRDVENLLGVFLTVWMYLTPVLYPIELVPQQYRQLYSLNPMVGIINAYRNTIVYQVSPSVESFSYSIVCAVLMFFLGYLFFKNKSRNFADVI